MDTNEQDIPRRIRIDNLSVEFDADQLFVGNDKDQSDCALEVINLVLERQPYGLGAVAFRTEEQKDA